MRARSLSGHFVSAFFAVFVFLTGAVFAPALAATFEEELDKFIQEPLVQAVIDGEPAVEKDIRDRLTTAYRTGGEAALAREAQKIGEEYGEARMMQKIPGARDQDVVEFFATSVAITRKLEFEDPHLCYAWAYGAQYNDPINPTSLQNAMGKELSDRLLQSMVRVIKFAADTPVLYDRAAAQLSLQTAATAVLGRLDLGPLQVISGMRPASSLDEKAAVCRATGDLYAFVLGLDNAPDALREMLSPQQSVGAHVGVGGMVALREVFKAGDPENIFAGNKESLMNAFK